eukprot:3403084-Pyramimonas_sp.AAC.1
MLLASQTWPSSTSTAYLAAVALVAASSAEALSATRGRTRPIRRRARASSYARQQTSKKLPVISPALLPRVRMSLRSSRG